MRVVHLLAVAMLAGFANPVHARADDPWEDAREDYEDWLEDRREAREEWLEDREDWLEDQRERYEDRYERRRGRSYRFAPPAYADPYWTPYDRYGVPEYDYRSYSPRGSLYIYPRRGLNLYAPRRGFGLWLRW